MSKFIGRLVNVGLGKESPRGTAVAPTWWIPKSSVAFFDRATKHKSKLSYGNIGGAGMYSPKIMEWAEGNIEGDIFDQNFGMLLLALLGTDTPSGPVSGVYTHAFSVAASAQHQSLTITLADPDRTDRYSLAMIDKLEINLVPDDVVSFVGSFKARTGRNVAAASAAFTAENKYLGRHASVKVAASVAALVAASALNIRSLKLRINKNLVFNNVLGTVWPDDILNSHLEIDGEIELDTNDQTWRNYMLGASYLALRIQLTNSDVIIGTGTSNPTFTLDLARVHFEAWEPLRPNDDIVTQKINFIALYDLTTNSVINSCSLVNAVASY